LKTKNSTRSPKVSNSEPSSLVATWAKTLQILAQRDYFIKEFREKLNCDDDEVAKTCIDRAVKLGFLNDQRVAEQFIDQNKGKQAVSENRLRERLLARGADASLMQVLKMKQFSPEEILTLNLFIHEPDPKQMNRAARLLERRGFDPDEIENAITSYFNPSSD